MLGLIKKRLMKTGLAKNYFDVFLIIIAILIGSYLDWEILNIAVFSLFIFYILRPFPSIIFVRLGFLSLIIGIPLMIIDKAEDFMLLFYYFLGLTVISKIYEFVFLDSQKWKGKK
jgi:hypothetical protein